MWKDYFSFNKRQRNGIIVLLSIIVVMVGWLIISNHLPPKQGNVDLTGFKSQVLASNNSSPTNATSPKIELNDATFSSLESNSAIAPYTKSILNYREKLGGFISENQLLEIKDIDTSAYNSMCNCITIDSTKIHTLALNTSTAKQLSKHPYIGHFLAQAIVNYREQHGVYKTVKDLLKNAAIDKVTYTRIAPYLNTN